MASYLILTPPGGPDPDHRSTRIIRDGFSGTAFVLPAIWLFGHRLWLAGFAALLLQSIGFALLRHDGFAPAGFAVLVATSVLVALEGRTLFVDSLVARGWRMERVVTADRLDIAEDIYFTDQEAQRPAASPPAAGSAFPTGHAPVTERGGPALGLFDLGGER